MIQCKQIEEWSIPYVEGTLAANEREVLETHLESCDSCSTLIQQTKEMWDGLDRLPLQEVPTRVALNFGQMLEEEKKHLKTSKEPKVVSLQWRNAFMAAASVAILLMGYVMGSNFSDGAGNEQVIALQEESDRLKEEMTIALLENRSASKRIQAVNYSEEILEPDTKVLEAIINRLQFDENINVRLTAAEALSRFSDNELVKDAFINVLSIEENSEVQIAVIQFLVKVQDKRALVPMQTLLDKPEVPLFVKNKVDEGLKQLM
jgi:hypothetical protein